MNTFSRTFALCGSLALVPALSASAQYAVTAPGPAYGIPWTYQTAGSTAPGDIARGLGVFAEGYGHFLVNQAVAGRIQDDRARANFEYQSAVARSLLQEGMARRQAAKERNLAALRALEQQKGRYPTRDDINRGDAINLLLRDFADPAMELHMMKMDDVRLDAKLVRSLPLHAPAIGLTVRLADSQLPAEFVRNVIESDPLRYSAFQMDMGEGKTIPLAAFIEFLNAFELRMGKADRPDERLAHEALYRKLLDARPMLMRKPREIDARPSGIASARPIRPSAAPQIP